MHAGKALHQVRITEDEFYQNGVASPTGNGGASMSQHDKYFTFPIAHLQMGKPLNDVKAREAKERLGLIVDACHFQMWQHLSEETRKPGGATMVEEMAGRRNDFGYDGDDEAFEAAQQMFGSVYGSRVTLEDVWESECSLRESTSGSLGKKLARVRSDIVFDAFNGKMKWRDFAVLAAIFAGCFDVKRKATLLRMSQIGAMSLGYGSAKYVPNPELLPHDKAVGRTVEKLRNRGYFVKASPNNGRSTYYSNSLSENQMVAYIGTIKAAKVTKKRRSNSEIQRLVNQVSETIVSPKRQNEAATTGDNSGEKNRPLL